MKDGERSIIEEGQLVRDTTSGKTFVVKDFEGYLEDENGTIYAIKDCIEFFWTKEDIKEHKKATAKLINFINGTEVQKVEEIYKGKFLSVKKNQRWEYVERNNCTSAVVIIPVTEHNEIILVEQFRYPLNKNVIEFPAGLVGDEGNSKEDYLQAAIRELEEETGYAVIPNGDVDYYGEFCTSPGLTNEKANLVKVHVRKKEGSIPEEGIKVHVVKDKEFEKWLKEIGKTCDVSIKVSLYSLFVKEHLSKDFEYVVRSQLSEKEKQILSGM